MTNTENNSMNDQEISRAIAEACGYSRQEPDSVWFDSPNEGQIYIEDLPDYCNDLNAMHEAEKKLTKKRLQTYLDFLADAPRDDVYQTWTGSVFATARQRAEAFLKTIGKWKEARNEQ